MEVRSGAKEEGTERGCEAKVGARGEIQRSNTVSESQHIFVLWLEL